MWRGAAAVLVLLYHMATTTMGPWSHSRAGLNPLKIFEAIGIGGVDIFFVVSGVVMTLTTFGRLNSTADAFRYLKRRVARIYPMYWFVTIAVLLIAWRAPGLATRDKWNVESIAKSLVLWPQAEYPVVGVGWTLTFEMYFYLAFAVVSILPRRMFLPALAVWGATALALFAALDDASIRGIRGNLALSLFASPLALEFIAGCVIGWLFMRGRMPGAGSALVLGLAWFLAIGGWLGATRFEEAAYGMVRIVAFGVPAALLLYGTLGLEHAGRLRSWPALSAVGDASYSLYLTHAYVVRGMAGLGGSWFGAMGSAPQWLIPAVCFVASLAAGFACHRLIEKPLTSSFQRLLGVAPAVRR